MLIIRKNQTNNLIATVSMNKTLPNPYYLFSFQHIASKERVSFIPQVITSNVRYDKFRFVESATTDLNVTPPKVYFEYLGQYYYSIYEQISSGNTDPSLAYNKLESGRAWVIIGNDDLNECLFEPYISNDEDFSQVIYVSEEEQECIYPSPSPTVTPTITPTVTQTPTPSCTIITQYLEVELQDSTKFKLALWNNPNYTSAANAICDYIISGTAYGSLGTVYTGTETISTGQHQHQFDLKAVLQPNEIVIAFDVHSYTLNGCICPINLVLPLTPTPTPTLTPTMTPTPTRALDPDAEAYLNAMILAGGTGITSTVSGATNTLFTSLKSAGLYSKLRTMYPMLGGTSGSIKFNALNPIDSNAAFRLQFFGNCSFSSSGLTINNPSLTAAAYANTFFVPTTEFASNSITAGLYVDNFTSDATNKYWYGSYGGPGPNESFMSVEFDAGLRSLFFSRVNRLTITGVTQTTFKGQLTQGNSVPNTYVRWNGNLIDTGSDTTLRPNSSCYIGTLNLGGVSYRGVNALYKFFYIADYLTPTEAATMETIINTFQQTLGRNNY